MLGSFEQGLIIFFAVVLVPLAPAWILYRHLPSKAAVGGPFQGLSLKLGGAVAGYFLIALFGASVLIHYVSPKQADPKRSVTLRGTTVLEGIHSEDELDARLLNILLRPTDVNKESIELEHGTVISWSVRVPAPADEDGVPHFLYKEIVLEYPRYFSEVVSIEDFELVDKSSDHKLPSPVLMNVKPKEVESVAMEGKR